MKIKKVSYNKGIKFKLSKIKSLNDLKEVSFKEPDIVYVPTKQMKGVNPTVVVSKGDAIKVGTKLAESGNNCIASAVCGAVEDVKQLPSVYGGMNDVVIIKNNHKNEAEKLVKVTGKDNFLSALKNISIIDYDGETLLNKIIAVSEASEIKLVINLLTDEPYQQTTPLLVKTKQEDCVEGIKFLAEMINANEISVVYSKGYENIYREMFNSIAQDLNNANFVEVKANYPAGDELNIVNSLVKNKYLTTSISRKNGYLVVDLFSVYCLKKLLKNGEFVDSRPFSVIQIKGNKVETFNGWAKLGTTIKDLCDLDGLIDLNDVGKVVAGGPMRGVAIYDEYASLPMDLKSILLIDEKMEDRPTELPCIGCGKCSKVCPMNLQPNLIEEAVMDEDYNEANKARADLCSKCGCCSYVCPSKRYLTQRIYYAKEIIHNKGFKNE